MIQLPKQLDMLGRKLPQKKIVVILLGGILISLGILVADYYVSNMSFPILDSSPDLAAHAYVHDYRMDDNIDDMYLAVNMAKDKALAEEFDAFGRVSGTVAVSDRRRLTEFMDIVEDADYRYIFLDLRFEDNIVTPDDSSFYARIYTMPRLIYSCHRPEEGESVNLGPANEKGAYADYRTTTGSGFSRYEFLQEGNESVALRLFREMTGRTIRATSPGTYRDTDGSLCYNMQFVPFPIAATQEYSDDGRVRYPLLGSQLLGQHSPDELKNMVKDKLIVIGDFDNDRHDTYVGSVPGPLLSVYAWNLLNHDGHKVNYPLQIFLFVFYTIVTVTLLMPDDKKRIENPFLSIVLSLLGWGASLWLLKSALYWIFGLSFIVAIPTIVFSGINFIKDICSRQ